MSRIYESPIFPDYIPIENEPMGRDFSPNNFESSTSLPAYNYKPLSYRSDDRTLLDSWRPLKSRGHPEHFGNPELAPSLDRDFYLTVFVVFFFAAVVIFALVQWRHNSELRALLSMVISARLPSTEILTVEQPQVSRETSPPNK